MHGKSVSIFDHFEYSGPNGTHLCLILKLIYLNISSLFDGYTREPDLPVFLANEISKELLQGFEILRHRGVIHNGIAHIRFC
jgi:serine/threonine-protein kinase SRPK3